MSLSLNQEQIERFFSRIGLDYGAYADRPRDAAMLREIQFAYVTTVPYENLDILDGIPLALTPGALYEKIVERHRGGYCFELNGLYGAALRALGFGVTDYFARYLRGETSIPMRRHRVLAVEAEDATYLCDAGIGQSAPRWPLKLVCGLHQRQFGEVYRFEKDNFLGWVLCDLHNDAWRRFFSFTEEPQLDIDYAAASAWCELHPDSPFTKAAMLAIKTADGRKTLDGRTFKIFRGATVEVHENLTDEEINDLLTEHFAIER